MGEVLRWTDRVYGDVAIDDPEVLALIDGPTFARLGRIKQAGPSALAHPFKTVTRREHSLGVYLLLGRLEADRRERVAGLLHDISHTAFSHAIDFLYTSEEQDHHEALKPRLLHNADIEAPLVAMGFAPEDFYDDAIYPLLERPLPWLCADRLDYFLRDSLACGVSTPESAQRTLAHLTVIDQVIAFDDLDAARDAAERFAVMNRDWWASPTESYIYNEFADALREGFRLGVLDEPALLTDDATVLDRLRSAGSPLIDRKLAAVTTIEPEMLDRFEPRVIPKARWLDPPVRVDGGWRRLSELEPAY